MWYVAKFGGCFHGSQMFWLGLGTKALVKELKYMQHIKLIKKLKGLASANAKTPHLEPWSLVWHASYPNATLPTKK